MRDNNYIHALCEDENGEQFLVFCPSGEDEDAIQEAERYGFVGVEVIDWYDEEEAECSGLDEW